MNKENLVKKFEVYLKQREMLVTQLNQVDGILLYIQNELNQDNTKENIQEVSSGE